VSQRSIRKRSNSARPFLEAIDDQVLYSADALGGFDGTTFLDRDDRVQPITLLNFHTENEIDNDRSTYKNNVDELYVAQEVVFVDTDTQDYQQILDDLTNDRKDGRYFDIYILDNNIDGIQQISDVLATYDSLDAVHIVSHGFDGAVNIGSTRLDLKTLNSNEVEISLWSEAFDPTGDLLIYGCNLASSAEGQQVVNVLADFTGTDVAASVDLTGHALLGGNWDLEYLKGEVESDIAFSAELRQGWVEILAPGFIPTGTETLVNGNIANNQTTTHFGGGNVAIDPNGNYVVAWADTRSGNADSYIKIFNADGSIRVSELIVHSASTASQDWTTVAIADNGNIVVTWSDDRSGTYKSYMRLFDIDGTALTAETPISGLPNLQEADAVDIAADGSFVVVFQSAPTSNIYMQRFDASGAVQGGNTLVNTTTTNIQHHPDVAVADDGSYVVTWMSMDQDGSGEGMYAQRYNAAGVAQGIEIQINQVTAGDQRYGNVDSDAAGNFVVTWMSSAQDGSGQGIYARVFDSSGIAQTNEFLVNTTTLNDQGSPNVSVNDTGDFIITWHDSSGEDGSGRGIFAQQFDRVGNAVGGETQINTTIASDQEDATVALSGNNAVIVWSGNGTGDTQGVFAQRFNIIGVAPSPDIQTTTTNVGGLSLNADGGNDSYLVADNGSSILGGLDTVSVEIEASVLTGNFPYLIDYAVPSESNEFAVLINGSGQLRVLIGGTGYTFTTPTETLNDGVNRSIGLVWDGPSGNLSMYLDGVLMETISGANTGYTLASGGTLVMGNDQDTVGGSFAVNQSVSGVLQRVRFFNDVRTNTEMAVSYRTELQHDETGMIAQWNFDNLSKHDVITETVDSNNLTVMHTSQSGFIVSEASLTFQVRENAVNGTVVGTVSGIDPERELAVNAILAANPTMVYSAETGKFYSYIDSGKDWTTALADSQSTLLNGVSGNLVTINSVVENQIVVDLLNANGAAQAYFAASDELVEGQWRWYDAGVASESFYQGDGDGYSINGMYENWDVNNPNNNLGNQHYAKIVAATGLWDDVSGTVTQKYIIEYDADAVLDTTQALIYSFTTETVPGAFAIDASTGQITVSNDSLLDFETNAIHSLTVRTTDVDNNTIDEVFAVSLIDFVEANTIPSDLSSGIELNTDGGNSAYLQASDGGAILGGLTSLTIETTFAISETVGDNVLISYSTASANSHFQIEVKDNGDLFVTINGISGSFTAVDYSQLLLDGEQYHFALTWDNTNGDIAILVDGELIESKTNFFTGEIIAGGVADGNLLIGQDRDTTSDAFDTNEGLHGIVYDVRIWNKVRSTAEIALNHQKKFDSASLPSGLIANWQMDGFNGSNEVVDIVSGNNLSIGQVSGFVASQPVEDLHVTEHASYGTSVGFAVPTGSYTGNDIVSDGQFLNGDTGVWTDYTQGQTFGDWTVETGGVSHSSQYLSANGGVGIEMHAAGVFPNTIVQTLNTETGRQYQVLFNMSGNFTGGDTVKYLNVSAGGVSENYTVTESAAFGTVYEPRTLTFTASSSATDLRFTNEKDDSFAAIVTDIQVLELSQEVTAILNNDSTLSYDAATGKFYRFVNSLTDYNSALSAATGSLLNGVDGQLVTIRSEYENSLIQQYAIDSGNSIRIGARDTNDDGNWNWLDGIEESSEQFWMNGPPASGGSATVNSYAPVFDQSDAPGEEYARLLANGRWVDTSDAHMLANVIEWDANQVLSNYTFVLNDPSSNFEIDARTGEVTVAATNTLDYETQQSHNIDITVTDASGQSYLETMTIDIDNGIEPTQTVPGAQTIAEDNVLIFSSGNGNAVTVSDTVAATDSRLQVFISVNNNGVLNLSQTTGLSILGGSNGSRFMTIHGTESDINAAFEGMTFTPNAGFTGAVPLNISTSLGADMVGYYTFEGGDAIDHSVGLSQNGTMSNGATTVIDGVRGEVLSLDGLDDFVDLSASTPSFSSLNEGTVSGWINTTGTNQTLFSISDTSDTDSYVSLSIDNAGHLMYTVTENNVMQTGVFTSNNTINDGNWHHVAVTVDSGGNKLFIDGQLISGGNLTYQAGDSTTQHFFSSVSNADAMAIGRNQGSSGAKWHTAGSIDDTRIYSRALSTKEIEAIFTEHLSASDVVAISVVSVNNAPTFFVGDGIVTNFPSSVGDYAADVLLQADDKLIVVGVANDGAGQEVALTRFLSDGTVDTTFGTGGRVTNAFGSTDNVQAGALQGDGKILVAGYTNSESFIARFNADGSIDTSFDGDGFASFNLAASSIDSFEDILVQDDGKIVAVGYANNTNEETTVVRLNSNGSLDTSFNTTGTHILSIGSGDDRLNAVTIDNSNRIVAVGSTFNGTNDDILVMRFDTDGTLDSTFDADGIFTSDLSGNFDAATAVAIDSAGRIVLGGTTVVVNSDSFAMRLLDVGIQDSSFNSTGSCYSFN